MLSQREGEEEEVVLRLFEGEEVVLRVCRNIELLLNQKLIVVRVHF